MHFVIEAYCKPNGKSGIPLLVFVIKAVRFNEGELGLLILDNTALEAISNVDFK